MTCFCCHLSPELLLSFFLFHFYFICIFDVYHFNVFVYLCNFCCWLPVVAELQIQACTLDSRKPLYNLLLKEIHCSDIFLLPVLLSSRGPSQTQSLCHSNHVLHWSRIHCPSLGALSWHITNLKCTQRFLTFWRSLEAELMSLPDNVGQQPKSRMQNTESNKINSCNGF